MFPHPYGNLPTGETVEAYSLINTKGFSLEVITYGATVTSLHVPDRHGRMADVVLGFSNFESYLGPHPYFGATIGRVAGRISGARFTLDGSDYPLAVNDPPNHLHGGTRGFDRRLWKVESASQTSLRLSYHSPEGEEEYPGTVDAVVTYTVTEDNAFTVEIEATSDRVTPFNSTHHSYFNLAGEGSGTIGQHELEIFADTYAPTDEFMTLLGRREPVVGNDFTHSRRIAEVIPQLHKSHGDLYFLRDGSGLAPAARLVDPGSGRVLSVSTTEPCVQFYTGVSLDGTLVGKSGRAYEAHAGLCLECQGYSDAVNSPTLGNILISPDRPLRQVTKYAFSIVP